MIEIKCTQEEKEQLINKLAWSDNCFLPTECVIGMSCEECLDNNIKWVIAENYTENYAEKLVNAVSKTIVEAFESLTNTDIDMYGIGYK